MPAAPHASRKTRSLPPGSRPSPQSILMTARSRHYKTPRPPTHICTVCEKKRFTPQMAQVKLWGPDADGRPMTWAQQMPWCRRCQDRPEKKNPALYAKRREAYRQYLLSTWDGVTMRRCGYCAEMRPDVLYPYTSGGTTTTLVRRKKCVGCTVTSRGHETPIVHVNAFDVTRAWIEETSQRTWEAWRQREHNAQCILMREMTGVPHHITSWSDRLPEQEQQWRQIVQRVVTQYVPTANSWRAWHCG